jgi:hypothetical protein
MYQKGSFLRSAAGSLRRDLIETRLFDAAQDDISRVPVRILLLGPGVPAVGPAVLGTDGALSQGAASGVGLLRLLPYFALDENYRYKTINAKAETVSQLPSFREPFRLSAVLCRLRGFMNQIKYIMCRCPGKMSGSSVQGKCQ